MKRICILSLFLLQEILLFVTRQFLFLYFQNTCNGEKSWEVLLGHVVSELSMGKIYEEQETDELTVVLANFLKIYVTSLFYLLLKYFSVVVVMTFL